MPTAPNDISFTRLMLGIGPKTTKQTTVAAPKKKQERVVLNLGGKLYTVVDIKKPSTMAAPGPPPPAATIPASVIPAPAPPAASVGTPAPEPPAAAPEPAAAAPESAAAAPAAAEADATAEVPAWTDVQDALLLGLKAIGNKTWKEIGKLFEGKDTEDLRERYAELTTAPKGETKVDAVVEGEKTPNTTDEETEGKKDKKNKTKNKKRGDTADTNDQEGKGEAVSGKKKKDKHGQDNQPKGILKPEEATQEQSSEVAPGQPNDDGAQSNYRGHPIISIDAKDGLSTRELLYLSNFHERLEQEKWLQLASKLFDKTGKRIPPYVLRERFTNLNLL